MIEFVVTSTNEEKIEATRRVLQSVLEGFADFTVKGCEAPSEVSDQPISVGETKRGAVNRIFNAKFEADFIISIESGVDREFDAFYSFTFAAISNRSRTRFGFGTSTKFQVPDHVAFGLTTGKTLKEISHSPEGLIANVTGDRMKQTDLIAEAVMVALSFFHFYPTPIPPGVPRELLTFLDSLSPIEKNMLATQLSQLEFEAPVVAPACDAPIEPLMKEDVFLNVGNLIVAKMGITQNRYAVVLYGGNTDLKPLEPCEGKTYLEIQLTRLSEIQPVRSKIPVVIVTSEANHSSIAAFLINHGNFGLHSVTLLKQRNLPVRTESGEFLLRSRYEVESEPVGKGYIFDLLKNTGTLATLEELGVQVVFMQDLMKTEVPGIVDFAKSVGCNVMACATKNGTLGKFIVKRNGKIAVANVDESIQGQFEWRSTGRYMFSLDFIKRTQLPFHVKTVERTSVDAKTTKVIVYKKKLSDALAMADKVSL